MSACTPCPYTEVVRSFDVEVDGAKACELAQDAFGRREVAPSISATACAEVCKDGEVNACHLDSAYQTAFFNGDTGSGGAGGGSSNGGCPTMPEKATITCEVTESHGEYHSGCPVAGRRPAALEEAPAGDGSVGAYLARAAHLEAASVIAFQDLAAELAALGAPPALVADARAAEADEVRHAVLMTELARAHGAETPALFVGPRVERSIAAIALENAVEGTVRETFGAAVALHQARHAEDAAVRAAFASIAEDECVHAALSFRVAAFLEAKLGARDRAHIAEAKQEAIATLLGELSGIQPAVARRLGLPAVAVAQQILVGIEGALWAPAIAA
ncbi:putative lipoprotein [Minicystis rosea]|nr:putative lipoprotein [Minicystis rosea]